MPWSFLYGSANSAGSGDGGTAIREEDIGSPVEGLLDDGFPGKLGLHELCRSSVRQRCGGAVGAEIALWPKGSGVFGVMCQFAAAIKTVVAGIIILVNLHNAPPELEMPAHHVAIVSRNGVKSARSIHSIFCWSSVSPRMDLTSNPRHQLHCSSQDVCAMHVTMSRIDLPAMPMRSMSHPQHALGPSMNKPPDCMAFDTSQEL